MSTFNEKKKAAPENATAPKSGPATNTFEGKVVSITGDKLVMANKEGKEYSHTLAGDARLTCDGTDCKAEDIKPGRNIRVTATKGDRNVATCVESLDKNAEFAPCS